MAFVPKKVISIRHRRRVEAGTSVARLGLLIFLPVCVTSVLSLTAHAAEAAKAVSAEDIRVLQEKYRHERADAEKSGAVKKFSPERLKQADLLAKKGESDLAAGRLSQARDAFREARWHLPILPADLPEHITRIFGSLKLRHDAPILALAYSPDGKRLAAVSGDLRSNWPAYLRLPTEVKI